jgi:hypothetical protein
MVIAEATVPEEKWDALIKAFKSGLGNLKLLPIIESFLVQSNADPTIWRIVSIWQRQDLERAQRQGMLPGQAIFLVIGATSTTSTFKIAEHAQKALVDPKDGESRFKE